MKSLYLYTDANNPADSNAMKAAAAGIPYTELKLESDFRKHDVTEMGVLAVIEIDGSLWKEIKIPDELAQAWAAAPNNTPAALSASLKTEKWNGAQWVVEPEEFEEGQTIRLTATIQTPDGATYTGPGSNLRFKVPLFKGIQGAPTPAGAQTVEATDEQVALLSLQFTSGVAVANFSVSKSMWICAVPGKTSAWLKTMVSRAIVTKPMAV